MQSRLARPAADLSAADPHHRAGHDPIEFIAVLHGPAAASPFADVVAPLLDLIAEAVLLLGPDDRLVAASDRAAALLGGDGLAEQGWPPGPLARAGIALPEREADAGLARLADGRAVEVRWLIASLWSGVSRATWGNARPTRCFVRFRPRCG